MTSPPGPGSKDGSSGEHAHTSAVRRRLSDSLRSRGLWGTVGFMASLPARAVVRNTPLLRRHLIAYRDRRFDRKHRVDTAGVIQLARLDIRSPNREFGERYEGTEIGTFLDMLARLHIDHRAFTFLDLGSGKGRTLLLAATFPFKRVVGVEFSPELAAIAERNIATYRNPARVCKDLSSLCADATSYPLPDGNLVIYLGNPFREPVMTSVLNNLRAALEAQPRTVHIVYFNPTCGALLDSAPFLERTMQKGWCSIYRSSASLETRAR